VAVSSELISEFAKITNDRKASRIDEVTLYGEVIEYQDMICVKFDGTEEITPVTTVVEKDEQGNITNYKYGAASVKTGDRVSVNLKNHSATITGNLSDPPAGRAEFKVNENDIMARVGATEMWIKNEGVTFTGLSEGTTTIDGGCIKTGTIDADRLNLTGSISFGDLTTEVQNEINSASEDAAEATELANSASSAASGAYSVARSIANGSYVGGTFINKTTIKAPTIIGNEIKVYGTFQTVGLNENVTGYMGAAQGMTADGTETYGVALSYAWNPDTYEVSDKYVIVTDAGIRMQAGTNQIVVTAGAINITTGVGKAYYNGVEIGSGEAGTVTAVWG
jgi:hypothetical protein